MTLKVALPDTSLADSTNLRKKTAKAGRIARAIAVFRVEEVFVYKTGFLPPSKMRDADLLVRILRYLDTPQYLRRRIFPKSSSLQFAGTLPPLRISSHPLKSSLADLSKGSVRWGVQVRPNQIDLGFDRLIDYPEIVSERDPTLFRVVNTSPKIVLETIERSDVQEYWGYEASRIGGLVDLLKQSEGMTRIGFSRNAPSFKNLEDDIISTISNTQSVLAIFGGPERGIIELCAKKQEDIKHHVDFWVNTIEGQGTETVRLEEALLVSLGLLNNSVGEKITKSGYAR
ncbi:MAG: putative RNA uridine N3 methyltransferase [Candidatus Thorarchaeota archaeon]